MKLIDLSRRLAPVAVAGAGAAALLAGGSGVSASGNANGHQVLTLDCGSAGTITVSTTPPKTNSNGKGDFGAAQVVGTTGEHGMPTSFTFALDDLTTGQNVFTGTQPQGGGNAHPNQTTTNCTNTVTGTWADFAPPGTTPPPGVSPTDTLQETLTVSVIIQGS